MISIYLSEVQESKSELHNFIAKLSVFSSTAGA